MGAMLLSSLLLFGGAAAEPAAMVLDMKGTVTLQHGKEAPHKLGKLALLQPGDRLRVAAGGEARLVFLADGHRERLKPGGEAVIGAKGAGPPGVVERLPSARLSAGNLESLRALGRSSGAAVGILRGEPPETPQVVTPMYGTAVLTTRPALSWPALARADGYFVEMFSGTQGPRQRLLWKTTTKEPRLAYPAQAKPLQEGRLYRWRVRPLVGKEPGEPLVQSKFSTLTEDERQELAEAAKLAAGQDAEDWALAAALYEAHGVFDQALRLYERLAERDRAEPAFQQALASYYARAGRPDQARAARERAKKLGATSDP